MKYLAYGSNLSVEQMAYRCPDAEICGKAILKDWKLVFRTHATIEPEKGSRVPALIWEISRKDEKRLDRYEGWPRYYVKKNLPVTMTDLEGGNLQETTVMAYIMTPGNPVRTPMAVYYKTLEEGYRRFGFDMGILEKAYEDTMEVGRK